MQRTDRDVRSPPASMHQLEACVDHTGTDCYSAAAGVLEPSFWALSPPLERRSENPSPPVRLPGVSYPGDAVAESAHPKLKPTGQRSRLNTTEHCCRASHFQDSVP